MNSIKWTKKKPSFKSECLLLTAENISGEWEYEVYQIKKVWDNETWYLAWLTGDGDEYGDLKDLQAAKYCVLPLLHKAKLQA